MSKAKSGSVKRRGLVAIVIALGLFASPAGAQFQQQRAESARVVDINLHDTAAAVAISSPMGEAAATGNPATQRYGFFFNDAGSLVASAAIHASGGAGQGFNPVELGAGAKLFGIQSAESNSTVSALAMSGSAAFSMAGQLPQHLIIAVNIAPNITSFGKASRVYEMTMRYHMDVTPQAGVYLGYRYMRVNMEEDENSNTMDSNLHLGIQLRY